MNTCHRQVLYISFCMIILLIPSFMSLGCNQSSPTTLQNSSAATGSTEGKTAAPRTQAPSKEKLISLYYPNNQLHRLVPEKRTISGSIEDMVQKTFDLLVAGPKSDQLVSLIPPSTRLQGIKINGELLELDFSKALTQINLGSSGEAFLIGSLVNSFCTLGFSSVQINVDGQKLETLAGHVDISKPQTFSDTLTIRLGAIPLPPKFQEIQQSTDQGHQPWRLDPVEVARVEGITLGFLPDKDTFRLVSKSERGKGSGTGEAIVRAHHGKTDFLIQLIQPAGAAPNHIWVINSVAVAE